MSSFLSMQENLLTLLSGSLTQPDIATLINRAQRFEVENYNWFSLRQLQSVISRAPYVLANVTVQTDNPTVYLNDPAIVKTAWKNWYFWGGGGPSQFPPMRIVAVDSASNTLTLETGWPGPDDSVLGYQLAPLLYPVVGALEVYSVSGASGVPLEKTSRNALHYIDPSRIATGGDPAVKWAPGPRIAVPINAQQGVPTVPWPSIELWPLPASSMNYWCEIKLAPIDMVEDTDQPMIASAVIEEKALQFACETMHARSADKSWLALRQTHAQNYAEEVERARSEDRKLQLRPVGPIGEYANWSPGIDILYNHNFGG